MKVRDANGNLPTDLYGIVETRNVLNKVVLVAVRAKDVNILGADDASQVIMDKNGEATFTVQMPADAVAGTSVPITVNVLGTTISHTLVAMYGEADGTDSGMDPGVELDAVTDVTTGPFNEGGVIQVNWDGAPDATGYVIYAVNLDELDDEDGQVVVKAVNDADAETYLLEDLTVGATYDIYVVATAKGEVAWPEAVEVMAE